MNMNNKTINIRLKISKYRIISFKKNKNYNGIKMAANHTILNLESLLKLSDNLNTTTDEMFIINSSLLSIMGKLRAIRGAAYIYSDCGSKYTAIISKGKIINSEIPVFNLQEIDIPYINDVHTQCKMLQENGYEYLFPLIYHNKLLAFMCIGNRLIKENITEEEIKYADMITRIAAGAINHARNYTTIITTKNNLEVQNQLLNSIFEMSRDFSIILSRDNILKNLSYRLMGQLMVPRFCLLLKNNENNYSHAINRFDKNIPDIALKELETIKQTSKIKDITLSPDTFRIFNGIKAKIFSPMIVQNEIKGFLIIGKKITSQEFTEENVQFIEALGNTAIAALENERLFKEEVEKKKLESELTLALEIQTNLLPKETPIIDNYTIAGRSIPSRHVGGDYYDFIKLNEDEIMIAIADVSGKGIPASLLMANVQAALRVLTTIKIELNEIVERINSIVYQNTSADKFVTFFVGILNHKENTFSYVNAGHNPPILYSNTDIKLLDEGGLILGIFDEGFPYRMEKLNINRNDVICLYTDGVTEAQNKNIDEFGEEKIIDFIKNNNAFSATQMLDMLLNTVYEFTGTASQYDDITSVFIKRES